jgi:class 3 adenylate cyclase
VLPTGTVTFLFTDVEGSTRLWAVDKDAMSASLVVHDELVRRAVASTTAMCSRPMATPSRWPSPVRQTR